MLGPDVRQAIQDRIGGDPDKYATGDTARDREQAFEALWGTWTDVTAQLQEFGVAPRSMCDAVNEVAAIRQEATEREQAAH